MFNHKHYVPILKWKQGEYQALDRLTDPIKANITPLLEVQPIGTDPATQQPRESIDQHLGDFARRLNTKWQNRRCFVDLRYVLADARMADGRHYVEKIFTDTRSEACAAIPVVSLSSNADFLNAVRSIHTLHQCGICLRLTPADFDRPNLPNDLQNLLRTLGLSWEDADLVIDFATQIYPIVVIQSLIRVVPMLNRWRTFTVAATSFPASLAQVQPPFESIRRSEWPNYGALVGALGEELRIPTFGDYAITHPDPMDLDMRVIRPFAKIRYTYGDFWHIGRGTTVRTDGFNQFRTMSAALINQPYFDGPNFSAGDMYISQCAAGTVSTGNLTTWAWVGTNRHLTRVVADLTNLHGL